MLGLRVERGPNVMLAFFIKGGCTLAVLVC